MSEPLTIELDANVMRWLEDQAAELAQKLGEGQGGEVVTPAAMAAAFVTHQFSEWTGETAKKESM